MPELAAPVDAERPLLELDLLLGETGGATAAVGLDVLVDVPLGGRLDLLLLGGVPSVLGVELLLDLLVDWVVGYTSALSGAGAYAWLPIAGFPVADPSSVGCLGEELLQL